jgi:glycosyltransferase involved in cell wall biosynthesis
MKKLANDQFDNWRKEGSLLIQQNFEVFCKLIAQAKEYANKGKYDAAAVQAEIACAYAFRCHCGFFVSPDLEELLLMIGQKAIQSRLYHPTSAPLSSHRKYSKILHVATTVWNVGGHSNMLWQWINQDSERSHSVVLTRQAPMKVPEKLSEAVLKSDGKIYLLNETIGSFISWAKELRRIASIADVIVLHTMDDVIPIIAFADIEQSPPIIFINHADERFWVGTSIVNIVANLRESGMQLSQERRGVNVENNVLFPTIFKPNNRIFSREEAKQKLDFPEKSILLLSVARSVKYKTIGGANFAEAHVPLLRQFKQAILVVIGLNKDEDWSSAIQETEGRIKVLEETEDTATFLQAADIYVDSFPWVSITSLLEAGSYGIPLVSRFPYSNKSTIYGSDTPSLANNLIRVSNLEDYISILGRLVENKEFRESTGEVTKKQIEETHSGKKLQSSLEDLYSRAANTNRTAKISNMNEQPFLGEPDVLLPIIYRHAFSMEYTNLNQMLEVRTRHMPLEQRIKLWRRLLKGHFKEYTLSRKLSFLLPNWLYLKLKNR